MNYNCRKNPYTEPCSYRGGKEFLQAGSEVPTKGAAEGFQTLGSLIYNTLNPKQAGAGSDDE